MATRVLFGLVTARSVRILLKCFLFFFAVNKKKCLLFSGSGSEWETEDENVDSNL